MGHAAYPLVRGHLRYNTNHFAIEDFYLLRIEKGTDGQYVRKIDRKVYTGHKDSYAASAI